MKLFALIPVIALAGCASQDYGSWLDQVGRLPNPRVQMGEQEASDLTADAIRLRVEAEVLRLQLIAETNRVKRMDRYIELTMVNDQLAPIERRLIDAGRVSRSRTPG